MLDAVRRPNPRRKLPAISQTLQVAMPMNPPPTICQRCSRDAHPCQPCSANKLYAIDAIERVIIAHNAYPTL